MKIKLDTHTHSTLSYDGGISADEYIDILKNGALDVVAVTDHNEIDFAKELHKELGDSVIVGEEVRTKEGDLIGLFLDQKIEKGVDLSYAIDAIREQGGLVYIPHPFDPMRNGVKLADLMKVIGKIDILEVFNSRYIFPFGNRKALNFAQSKGLAKMVGSDSHSKAEIGSSVNYLSERPTRENFLELVAQSDVKKSFVKPWNFLNPKRNMLRKAMQSGK